MNNKILKEIESEDKIMGSRSWTTSAYNCSIRDIGFTSR